MDGLDEAEECFQGNVTQQLLCASGGYESLRDFFKILNTSFEAPPQMFGSAFSFEPLIIKSSAPQIPDLQSYGSTRGWRAETELEQPNMITSILPSALVGDWRKAVHNWSGGPFSAARQYQYALRTLAVVSTTNPILRIRCSETQNVSAGLNEIRFPIKTWNSSNPPRLGTREWQNVGDDLNPFNVTVLEPNSIDDIHMEWVALPPESFGPVSGGIFLQYPWQVSNNTAAIVGCSVAAAWFRGDIRSDSNAYGSAWDFTSDYGSKLFSSRIRDDLNASSPQSKDHLRLITIRRRWFESLNSILGPTAGVDDSTPRTTLQQIFSDVGLRSRLVDMRTQWYSQYNSDTETCFYGPPNLTQTDVERTNDGTCEKGGKTSLIEFILGSAVLNGLSRYGSRLAFEPKTLDPKNDVFHWELKDTPKAKDFDETILSNRRQTHAIIPPPPDSDFVTLHLRFEVNGYAWYASSVSDYFATVVICCYILIAIAHTVWILVWRTTSCSWDTATELLALALQSPPITSLLGSGAGIEKLDTYKKLIKLKAVKAGDENVQGANEKLVLVQEAESSVEEKGDTDALGRFSSGIKQMMIMSAAPAIPSISMTMSSDESQADQSQCSTTYEQIKVDKKYL